MAQVIVFDVNETLLDLAALDDLFSEILGSAGTRQAWFQQVLRSALVTTVVGEYCNYSEIAVAAIESIAARRGIELRDDDCDRVLEGMLHLPPHSDVVAGLDQLRVAGFKLATLSNMVEPVSRKQLSNAGLIDYFEAVLSADAVRTLKPAADPYRYATKKLGIPIRDMRLVAAHSWDIAGALKAGSKGAFVTRSGDVLDPLFPPPDIVGKDVSEFAVKIIEKDLP